MFGVVERLLEATEKPLKPQTRNGERRPNLGAFANLKNIQPQLGKRAKLKESKGSIAEPEFYISDFAMRWTSFFPEEEPHEFYTMVPEAFLQDFLSKMQRFQDEAGLKD